MPHSEGVLLVPGREDNPVEVAIVASLVGLLRRVKRIGRNIWQRREIWGGEVGLLQKGG